MTPGQLAQWLHAPWLADKVKRVEVEPAQPQPHIWLMEESQFDSGLQMCTLQATEVAYEASSARRPGGNPDNALVTPTALPFRLGYRPTASSGDCSRPTPVNEWIYSRSEASVATALRAMNEVLASINADGSTRLPIACEDRTQSTAALPACQRPGLILKRLTPAYVRAVQPVFWKEPTGSEPVPESREGVPDPSNGAWRIIYVDPAGPASGRIYAVTLAGVFHPKAVKLVVCRQANPGIPIC